MPLDPTIPLGVKPVAQADPFNMIAQWAQIQNAVNQNRLFQQTFAARQRLGQIMSNAPTIEEGFDVALKDPLTAPFAGEQLGYYRQAEQARAQIDKAVAETGEIHQRMGKDAIDAFKKNISAVLANPTDGTWNNLANSVLAATDKSVQAQVAFGIDSLKKSILDGLPDDPNARRERVLGNVIGLGLASGMPLGTQEELFGKPSTIEGGGYVQPTLTLPPYRGGGQVAAGQPFEKTLAPQVASGETASGQPVSRIVGGGVPASLSRNQLTSPAAAPAAANAPANLLSPGIGAPAAAGTPAAAGAPAAAAPSGAPLFVGPTATQKSSMTSQGVKFAEYADNLNNRVLIGSQLMNRIGEMLPLMQAARIGGGTAAYTKLAQFAQAIGAPTKIVDRIQGGSLSAAQEFQKFAVQTAVEQLKQQLSTGRLTNLEFGTFQEANPNLETDPRAIEKIFQFLGKVYRLDKAEQDSLATAQQSPNFNPATWPNRWQNEALARGLWSANPVEQSKSERVKINSEEEWKKLKPGTKYLDPQGVPRTKGAK